MNKTGLIILIILVLAVLGFVFYGNDGDEPMDDDMPVVGEMTSFMVTVRNVHEGQPLSPGVYALHTDSASLNFDGVLSPSELEPLAEYGSNADFAEFVRGMDGVVEVITIDAPVLPGEEASFEVSVDMEGLEGYRLSGIMMMVGTNDGFALLDSVNLSDTTVMAMNYDNGTEENQLPGGGFDAGQPDPSRGEENVENGTPTVPQAPVSVHDQVVETVMEVEILAK